MALGLRDDELAFYDAICENEATVLELGDDILKTIARELVTAVRESATIDPTARSARSSSSSSRRSSMRGGVALWIVE